MEVFVYLRIECTYNSMYTHIILTYLTHIILSPYELGTKRMTCIDCEIKYKFKIYTTAVSDHKIKRNRLFTDDGPYYKSAYCAFVG